MATTLTPTAGVTPGGGHFIAYAEPPADYDEKAVAKRQAQEARAKDDNLRRFVELGHDLEERILAVGPVLQAFHDARAKAGKFADEPYEQRISNLKVMAFGVGSESRPTDGQTLTAYMDRFVLPLISNKGH